MLKIRVSGIRAREESCVFPHIEIRNTERER